MKKIIQTLLIISLVFAVSCTAKSGCPYMKAKGQCEAGCSASCDKAKEMKSEMDKSSCGSAKCGASERNLATSQLN